MTDPTPETTETPEVVERPVEEILAELDDPIISNLFERLTAHVSLLKETNARLSAADPEKAINEFVKNSDDADMVKLRTQLEKIQAKMRELASTKVGGMLSEGEKSTLELTRDTHASGVAKCRKGLTLFAEDHPNKETVLALMSRVVGTVKRAGGGGSTGSSLPRANVLLTVTKGEDVWEFGSFSEAKTTLKWDVEAIGRAFAEAANVPYEEISSVDTAQSFYFEPNEGVKYLVETRPKPVGARGRKPKAAA